MAISEVNNENWSLIALYVTIAAAFDFLDGFVARALNQRSPIGEQLDSLADMVTFGVLPGLILFQMIQGAVQFYALDNSIDFEVVSQLKKLKYLGLLIPVFSAIRLARFNLGDHEGSFKGLPTPANAIMITALPLIQENRMEWFSEGSSILFPLFLIAFTALSSYLLVSKHSFLSFKFKTFTFSDNKMRYILIGLFILLASTLQYLGVFLTLQIYITLSLFSKTEYQHE